MHAHKQPDSCTQHSIEYRVCTRHVQVVGTSVVKFWSALHKISSVAWHCSIALEGSFVQLRLHSVMNCRHLLVQAAILALTTSLLHISAPSAEASHEAAPLTHARMRYIWYACCQDRDSYRDTLRTVRT